MFDLHEYLQIVIRLLKYYCKKEYDDNFAIKLHHLMSIRYHLGSAKGPYNQFLISSFDMKWPSN